MPLVNCKIELSLMSNANYALTTNPNKDNVLVITLSTKDCKIDKIIEWRI